MEVIALQMLSRSGRVVHLLAGTCSNTMGILEALCEPSLVSGHPITFPGASHDIRYPGKGGFPPRHMQ